MHRLLGVVHSGLECARFGHQDVEACFVPRQVCRVVGDPADQFVVVLGALDVEFAVVIIYAAAAHRAALVELLADHRKGPVQTVDHSVLLDQAPHPVDHVPDLVTQVLHFQRNAVALVTVCLASGRIVGLRLLEGWLLLSEVRSLVLDAAPTATAVGEVAGIAVPALILFGLGLLLRALREWTILAFGIGRVHHDGGPFRLTHDKSGSAGVTPASPQRDAGPSDETPHPGSRTRPGRSALGFATIAQRCGDTRPATLNDVAGYRGLAAAGRSIVDLLNRRIAETLPAGPRPTAVMAGTVDFDQVNSSPVAVIRYPAISLYCYKVSVDRETRPGWSAVGSVDGIARIPLRMHLMISAWDTVVESELEWLGLAAQILESEPILTGPLLHPSGNWEPSDMVQIVPDDVALESMSEAFQALTTDYRLTLLYIARVIIIQGRRERADEPVTTVAAAMAEVTS